MLAVEGSTQLPAPEKAIDCGDSASTLRFLTAVASLADGKTVLTGSERLRKRPIGPLVEALIQLGAECYSIGNYPPVTVSSRLNGGHASLPGNISSQFLTGLLLACPKATDDTTLTLTTPLESRPYVTLTTSVIQQHGIRVKTSRDQNVFEIPGNQRYKPSRHVIPGDFSSAAFLMVAAAVTQSHIVIENLAIDQPDSEIVSIMRKMGVNIRYRNDRVEMLGGKLTGAQLDARDTPDLVPPCAVLAALSEGETRIWGAERLRIKESDRLRALTSELRKLGVRMWEHEDGLTIRGPGKLKGTRVDSHNDHRIAMACTIVGLKADSQTEIIHGECVEKSYPEFYRDLNRLGGCVSVR
jgi:3-phosphoshikimate 1-carboxyvinyltransferase